jgi:hypothetical protein
MTGRWSRTDVAVFLCAVLFMAWLGWALTTGGNR